MNYPRLVYSRSVTDPILHEGPHKGVGYLTVRDEFEVTLLDESFYFDPACKVPVREPVVVPPPVIPPTPVLETETTAGDSFLDLNDGDSGSAGSDPAGDAQDRSAGGRGKPDRPKHR